MLLYQHDQAESFRFVAIGDLEGDAVGEFRSAWRTASSVLRGRDFVVDLSGVTGAGQAGLDLLSEMQRAGVHLRAEQTPECVEVRRFLETAPAHPRAGRVQRGRARGWLRLARFSE